MEPVAVSLLSESASALKAALEAIPPSGGKRQWHRDRRLHAYLAFQQAAHEASVWPTWLSLLEEAVLAKRVTVADVMPDLSAARSATSGLLAALSEIRLVGNPEPRQLAEEIVTLLIELMEARIPGRLPRTILIELAEKSLRVWERKGQPEGLLQRMPTIADRLEQARTLLTDQETQATQAARFNDCQMALGTWHRKFTLAARKDLGYGPRWWHIGNDARTHWWQPWRPRPPWPGGWPPPEAHQLITRARTEREMPDAETIGQPDLPPGPESA